MHIIDAVNQTSNKFAVSSADIATNLNKMSSVMAVNNVTFEEQIGLLVGVTELTRNASSATRGLTMIASRLTQVLDESSSTGKKLTAIYEGLGIKLKDENGQLRSTTAILKDLSEKWDSLSDNEQKYISLTSAGARQQNVFTSLMKNFNTVINATEEAYNSTGSAARENAKVMDSVAKKVEILKSEFQQIVIGKGGLQELSKGFLDIGISALKLIDSIGGLTPLFVTLAGVIVTMKADSIVEGFANFNRTCLNLTQTLSTMLPLFREGRASGMSFGDALRYAGITASTAQLALGALTTVISIAVIAFKKYQQQQEESHRKAVETLKDYENYSDSLSETLEKIKDENTSKEELIKINKNLNDSYDDEKAQLKDIKDLREENIKLLYKEAQEKARATVRETASETEKAKSYLGSKVKSTDLGGFNIDRNTLLDTMEYTNIMTSTIGKSRAEQLKIIENELDKYSEKISKNIELSKSESLTLQQLNLTYDILKEKYDTAINSVNIYKQAQEVLNQSEQEFINTLRTKASEQGISTELTIEEQNKLIEQYHLTEEAIQEVLDAEEDMTRSEAIQYLIEQADASNVLSEASKELSKHIEDCAKSLGITATELEGLRERFDDLTLDNFLSRLAEVRQTIDDTNTVIDNLQSALETASGALEEYNANGYLTIDTFQGLMSISAQYLATLVNENGQLEINQQTLGNLVDTLKIAKIEELAEAAAMEISALQHQESATSADAAQRAVDAAGDAFTRAGDKAAKASTGIALFNAQLKKATGGNLGDFSGSEKVIIDKYRKLAKEISTLSVNTTKAGNAASSAGRKGAGAAKQAKDATKELNKELEETKKKYDTVIKWISKQYDKEIDSIKKAEKEALKAEEEKIKAKEKEKDKALDAIEKEIKALEKAKDARKKYWDDQIDALKKANDARKDALELQEKLDALEKAKATKVKIYKEGQGFVYDVDQTAVAKAQKELDEYLSEKAYEDELARLEALRDAEMDNYEQRINAMNEYKDNVQANYEAQIEAMNEHKEQLEAQYEAEIEMYENYKQQFEDMVNAYEEEQNRLLAQQLTGIDFENKNWMTRLDNLQKFVNEYNKLQKQLGGDNTNVSADKNFSSGSSGGGGSSSGGSNSSKRTVTNRNTPSSQYSPTQSTKGVGTALSHQGYNGMPTNVRRYASGTNSISDDEIAIVGENPNQEIVIGSKINNGELMNLGKGTGVVNADSSKTLAGMLNQVGQFGASGFGSGNGTLNNNINNDSLVINGVTVQGANIKDPETFVNGLLNLKAEALQRAYRHR